MNITNYLEGSDGLQRALKAIRVGSVDAIQEIAGGAISKVVRVRSRDLPQGSVIVKTSNVIDGDVYEKEAAGLAYLNVKGCPRVPRPVCFDTNFLALEDLGEGREWSNDSLEEFAEQLHKLHSIDGPAYGFYYDNYLGNVSQLNDWEEDGASFFIKNRILGFLNAGYCAELLTSQDRHDLDSFCNCFSQHVTGTSPRLIHGDLWMNNILCDSEGHPAYMDPAVYYGFPEADLSMAKLYGGLSEAFWSTYRQLSGVQTESAEWTQYIRWFDIKELLAMVAYFGETHDCVNKLRVYLAEMQ